MNHLLTIPHRVKPGLCTINGLRDLIHWRSGRDWSNEFVLGLGQGGGFAYLRFKAADPPRQVYWGNGGPRQNEYLAQLLAAEYVAFEDRSFKFAWNKARQAVDAGTPPILGPLDMFHLHWYEPIYRQRHIPIHYLLLVGYDGALAYVQDTGANEVQEIPLPELESAWNVNVPGLGKRNRLAIFDIPQELAPPDRIIRQAIADQCQTMLNPPVSMVGIPAMQKLAREIALWPAEVGPEKTAACLRQVREYLNSPPDLEGNHLTAGRDLYITFLEEAGPMAGLDFTPAIEHLRQSAAGIPSVAQAIQAGQLEEAGASFGRIAAVEVAAFTTLKEAVQGASRLPLNN